MPLQHFTLLMAVGKKSGLVWKGLQQHHEAFDCRVSGFDVRECGAPRGDGERAGS
jgi:hypothetical protein